MKKEDAKELRETMEQVFVAALFSGVAASVLGVTIGGIVVLGKLLLGTL